MADTSRFDVLWPLSRRRIGQGEAVRPLQDLSGKCVAFVWDYMFHGETMFETLRELLQARYPGIRFVGHAEFGNVHGNDERAVVAALADKLKTAGADAAIVGIGA